MRCLVPLLAGLLFLAFPSNAQAQQWQGDTTATGVLYRSGKVGITISNPRHRMEVAHSTSTEDTTYAFSATEYRSGYTGGYASRSYALAFNDVVQAMMGITGSATNGVPTLNRFYINTVDANTAAPWASANFVIDNLGYVGIGTLTPGRPLHIRDDTDYPLRIESTDGFSGIEFVDPGTSAGNVSAAAHSGRFLVTTQGLERLTVSANGRVGIGVNDPQRELDINGSINARGSSGSNFYALSLRRSQGGLTYPDLFAEDDVLVLGGSSSGNGVVAFSNNVGIGTDDPEDGLHIAGSVAAIQLDDTDTAQDWRLFVNGNNLEINEEGVGTRLVVEDGGNVGVGVADPQSRLEVAGDGMFGDVASGTSMLNIRANGAALNFAGLSLVDGATSNRPKFRVGWRAGDKFEIKAADDAGNFTGARFLVIHRATGDVGIGTDSPNAKLAVNGTIKSKEVIVTVDPTEWADYVFEDAYDLRSLNEVETFIEENGHLPEVPSAKEVGESGVAVGAMQATLLKKIEELTLYLLEQQQTIVTLQKRLNALEK